MSVADRVVQAERTDGAANADAASGLADRLRGVRVPAAVVAAVIVVSALLAGWAWALSSPPGASPDDDYHQSSIWCPPPLERSGCQLVVDGSGKVKGAYVPVSVARSTCYALHNDTSASCLATSVSDTAMFPMEHIDQGDYPGGYYRFMHLFVTPDVTASIVAMRFFNVVAAVVLIGGGVALLPSRQRQAQLAAVVSGLVPLGMFLLGSVNPSSWAITGVCATWLGVHTLLQATQRWRMFAATGLIAVAALMAASARSDSGAYLVVVVGATALLHVRTLGIWWRRLGVLALAAVLGAWSYLGSGQSSAVSKGWAGIQGRDPRDVLFRDVQELPNLLMGVFGQVWGLGWLDTPMPAVVSAGALLVAFGLVMVGFGQVTWVKTVTVSLLLATTLAVALIALLASNYYVGEGIQPRYLLPLVLVLLGMVVTGREPTSPLVLARSQTLLIAVALTVANGLALFTNLRRYVTGLDVLSLSLNRGIEWWWPAGPLPNQTLLIGALGFAVLCLTPWYLTRAALAPATGQAPAAARNADTADPPAPPARPTPPAPTGPTRSPAE